jgi:hypothetical protein
MRQLTVTIPDNLYSLMIEFINKIPEASFVENEIKASQEKQQKIVLDRINSAKPEDYIPARESLQKLKTKYGF